MSRALFGLGAKGALIRELQLGLVNKAVPIPTVDGVFGSQTEQAVRAYQSREGLSQTGAVSADEWTSLTGKPLPSLAERCLQVTAAFEGHNYTVAAGNWDDAWVTWGIVGFTMKFGRVQEIVREVDAVAPHCMIAAFGADAPALRRVMAASAAEQKAWAISISSANGHRLVEPWQSAFARFGVFPEVQAAQRKCAFENYFVPALRTASTMGLTSELGVALCFDIHVQNGGISKAVRKMLPPPTPGQAERLRREQIANAVAHHSRPKFRDNVRRRKLTFATGAGVANGVNAVLVNWGLAEVPAVV